MHEIAIDAFDRAILSALQRDASLTNAQLSDLVNRLICPSLDGPAQV